MLETRKCFGCGNAFAPENKRQKYCSDKCREKIKKRLQRINRQVNGLCPQCGKPMDYPVRIGSGKKTGDLKISYCSNCREKFRLLHKKEV